MSLDRFTMAIVKRTVANVKAFRTKKARLIEKMGELQTELAALEKAIEEFEAPVRNLTGGFTSEEVMNGTMAEVEAGAGSMDDKPVGSVDEAAQVDEVAVPAAQAVDIDASVKSPNDEPDCMPFAE